MNNRFVWCIALFLFLLPTFSVSASANPLLALNDFDGEYEVIPYLKVIQEPSSMNSVTDMLSSDRWESVPEATATLNFGYGAAPHWARFQVRNESSRLEWLMQIDYPALDWVECYIVDGGVPILLKQGGDRQPFGSREVSNRSLTFRLTLEPGQTQTVLLRFDTEGAMTFPIKIMNPASYVEREQASYLLLGGYYGTMLIMIVYNSILAVSLRSKSYLYYVLINASAIGLYSTLNGIAFQYIWPDAEWWNNRAIVFFMCLSHTAALLFTRNFVNLKRYVPKMHGLFNVFIAMEAINVAVLMLNYGAGLKMASYTLIVLELAIVLAGGLSWYRGSKSASYFTIGWTVFMCGAVVSSLTDAGYLPQWGWATYASQIASLFEAVILSLGLAHHIQAIRREKELAVSLMKETRRMAETDDLTGLYNRRYMVNAFQTLESYAEQHGTEDAVASKRASLLMIDVDHFKRINDTYGHDIGDRVLIDVAGVLRSHCRPQDVAGRIGGEEFIVLMRGADIERAERKAVALLEAIRKHTLRIEGAAIQCTVSIGIAERRQGESEDFHRVLRRADEALYEAKRGGRNRVCRAAADTLDNVTKAADLRVP